MQERVHSDLYRQIGATIREWRTVLGLTQAALADRLVLDASDIGKVERGVRKITFPALIRFCDALDDAALAAPSSPPQMPNSRRFRVALLKVFATALGLPAPQFTPPLASNCSMERAHDKAHDEASEAINRTEIRIMEACSSTSRTMPAILNTLGYKTRNGNVIRGLRHLLDAGLIAMTMPTRPRSKNQKYRLTQKGKAWLASPHT